MRVAVADLCVDLSMNRLKVQTLAPLLRARWERKASFQIKIRGSYAAHRYQLTQHPVVLLSQVAFHSEGRSLVMQRRLRDTLDRRRYCPPLATRVLFQQTVCSGSTRMVCAYQRSEESIDFFIFLFRGIKSSNKQLVFTVVSWEFPEPS